MEPVVTLRPLDGDLLPALLATAVAEAEPREVMPAVPGADEWSALTEDAFFAFHRSRSADASETVYAVLVDGRVAGAGRLADRGPHLEAGIWLGRSSRGRGLGGEVLTLLLAEARRAGARRLVAKTTATNSAACQVLARAGATLRHSGEDVEADFELAPRGTP